MSTFFFIYYYHYIDLQTNQSCWVFFQLFLKEEEEGKKNSIFVSFCSFCVCYVRREEEKSNKEGERPS